MVMNLVDPATPASLGPDTELAARLRMAITRLSRRLRQQVDVPITPTQLSALSSVEATEPVTLGDLANLERIQPPSMTRLVAVLEEAGLVGRQTDGQDRRVVRVSTTAAGRRALLRSRTRKDAFLARRIRALPDNDKETLLQAIALLESILSDDKRAGP